MHSVMLGCYTSIKIIVVLLFAARICSEDLSNGAMITRTSQDFFKQRVSNPLTNDALILLQLKSLWDGESIHFFDSWQLSLIPSVCDWSGVSCNKSHLGIYSLVIKEENKVNISGTLPPDLGNFTDIAIISITNQNLSGNLPNSLEKLQNLTYFNVTGNQLGPQVPSFGTIPLETLDLSSNEFSGNISALAGLLGTNRTLRDIVVNHNEFSGDFPEFFCEFNHLRKLDFSYTHVSGSLSSCFENLQELDYFDSSIASFGGGENFPLPLTKCKSLRYLALSTNHYIGVLPPEIGNLTLLEYFDVGFNDFVGEVPATIGNLVKLQTLILRNNNFSGPLPMSLQNCTKLVSIIMGTNNFTGVISNELISGFKNTLTYFSSDTNNFEGNLPVAFADCEKLWFLELTSNLLNGSVPNDICSKTPLSVLLLGANSFTGPLPDIWKCYNFTQLEINNNHLTGPIPSLYGTNVSLRIFDASSNNLNGNLPSNISGWFRGDMDTLILGNNSLSGSIQEGIGHVPSLSTLHLNDNFFTGLLPSSLSKNPHLVELFLQNNSLSGPLWSDLSHFSSLKALLLQSNSLSGPLPADILSLPLLSKLNLSNNYFFGPLPTQVNLSSNLIYIDFSNNQFLGPIPPAMGNVTTLLTLNLANNSLAGNLPQQLANLVNLQVLNLGFNFLNGSFPEGIIQSVSNLEEVNLTGNELSGELPGNGWLSQAITLTTLDFSDNSLTGPIPDGIALLTNLKLLLLNNNSLSGQIPLDFANLSQLSSFNVSFNQLSGAIPGGAIGNFSSSAFLGNPQLCGPPLSTNCQLAASSPPSKGEMAGIVIGSCVVLIILIALILLARKELIGSKGRMFVFDDVGVDLTFDLIKEATENFHSDYKLGSGGSGIVYKVSLPNGRQLAVKRFHNLEKSSRPLTSEVESMAKIQHKNLAKLVACFVKDTEILLAYSYVPGGDMASLFHPKKVEGSKGVTPEWSTLLRLALGTARGIRYLHSGLSQPIIHRDIKLANVLVSEDNEALLTDFGLSRIVSREEASHETNPAGTIGYLAPECVEKHEASTKSDVFSFGVLLLVVVTGKNPTYMSMGDSDGLVSWSKVSGIKKGFKARYKSASEGELYQAQRILDLAWKCVEDRPNDRPDMGFVVSELEAICGEKEG